MDYGSCRTIPEDAGTTVEMSDFSQSAYRSPDVLFIRGTSGMVFQFLKAMATYGGVCNQHEMTELQKKKAQGIADFLEHDKIYSFL